MGPQFLKTPTGEELVVLSRHDYDVLLARLGDEDAEDRLLGQMADQAFRDLASGKQFLLPVWFSDALIATRNPMRAVREHFSHSSAQMAEVAGITEEQLAAFERNETQPPVTVLDAISASVGIEPRILRRMYDEPDRDG